MSTMIIGGSGNMSGWASSLFRGGAYLALKPTSYDVLRVIRVEQAMRRREDVLVAGSDPACMATKTERTSKTRAKTSCRTSMIKVTTPSGRKAGHSVSGACVRWRTMSP